MKRSVVIVGGGAAGFFSAINIAGKNSDFEVTILEKTNKLLSKVKVSGGGRCNVTHACFEPADLVRNYPRGERELRGPFHHFMTGDTIEWFSNRGVELKMEEDGRMFPVSDSSQTIIDCFLSEAKKLNVKIELNAEVKKLKKAEKFIVTLNNGDTIQADYVVLATGGNAKLKHYELAINLGHTINSPIPSLFTFNLPKHSSNKLMGLSLPAKVKIKGTSFEEYGPVLFTHWGMSGPAILKLSSKAAKYLYSRSYQFNFLVEWLESPQDLIEEKRQKLSSRKLINTKMEDFPQRFWEYLINRANIDISKNWADPSKSEMDLLAECLEADCYSANGKTTFKEEFVTCGGINLKEINMKTMESKLVKKLFLCGEVIDVDALTGGFNFQAAWTGGHLVAEAIGDMVG